MSSVEISYDLSNLKHISDRLKQAGAKAPNVLRLAVNHTGAKATVAIDDTFGRELAVVGVSLDDMIPDTKPEKVVSFLDRQKIAFPNIYYMGNADDLGDHLKFDGEIPLTILYDRKGKELWRHQGRLERETTIARVREILRRMQ